MSTLSQSISGKARILAWGALAATGLASAGCSGDPAAASNTLTIQVQAAQQPAFEYAAGLLKKKHPDVKVELQTITEQQKSTTNSQILASSGAPDVGLVPINAQPYVDLARAGKLTPLDDVWKGANLESRYSASIAKSLKWDGKPYLTLFDTTFYNVVYYNKTAFEKAGITAPKNHQISSNQKLYDIVSKLKKAGYDGLSTGGSSGYQFGWLVDAQLQANASDDALEDFLTSWQPGAKQTVPYTSPEFTESLAQISEWKEHGVFPSGVVGQSGDQAQAAFTAGDAGMLLAGTWIPSVLGDTDFDYDWLLLPGAGNQPTLPTLYAGDTLAIPTASKNVAMAKEFLKIYVSDEVQKYAAQHVGSLPAVKTVEAASVSELGPIVQSIIDFTNTTGFGLGWTSTLPGSIGQSFIDPQVQQLVSGQTTAKKIGEAEQQEFEKYKAQDD
ncbi:ABC transporter substrate-binding protein [Streptomyces europaeiscabiei]|uniref:ABC transporter substrate-binding protein n=1 Tax=Streptomyces europaeiscabiei TaxID=146819 RepID=UPI0038F76633